MGNDEHPDGLTGAAAPPEGDAADPRARLGAGDPADPHVPERRCILSGVHGPRAALMRLALGPDGRVAPDVRAKAPGRGAWIGVDRAALAAALDKGKLKGALQRAFKTAQVIVPADLPEQIERALERAALDRLGLEARAGALLTGSEKIADAARKGTVALLVHARDAAADGTRKLDQAWRVGLDRQGEDVRGLVIPAGRTILSLALGRENVVHLALIAPAAAVRVGDAIRRWQHFIGRDEGSEPCDQPSQGSSALRAAERQADGATGPEAAAE